MRRVWWQLLIVLVLAGVSRDVYASGPAFPRETVRQIIECIINGQFATGDSLAEVLIRQYPESPYGYFYRGAIRQARMIDRNALQDDPQFWSYMKAVIQRVEQKERQGIATPMELFFKGSAYYYMAFHHMKLHHWWTAYRYTRKGVHILEAAVRQDSTLWEAYLGIGAYKFWKSQKAGVLRFLLLIKDEKEQGLALVRQAVQYAHLVPELARDQLVYMLMDAGRPQQAWKLAKENLKRFPRSRFFLWTYAKASFAARQWVAADSAYRHIWQYVKAHPEQKNNVPHVLARLTRCACELGNIAEARRYFELLERQTSGNAPPPFLPETEWNELRHLPCLIGDVAQ